MKFHKSIQCIALTSLLTACTSYTTVRQHRDFAKVFPQYKSVAILAGDIFTVQNGKNGQQTIAPDPARVNNITQMAKGELEKKGYVITETITEDESESGDELKGSYTKLVSRLYANREMDKTENALSTDVNLGDMAAKFTKKSNADLLLVLGYTGNEMSQEEVSKNFAKDMAIGLAMSVLTRGQSSGGASDTHIKDGSAIIGLVDGHNGNLLWTNIGKDFEDYGTSVARMITKSNVMETAFSRALKELPDKTMVN